MLTFTVALAAAAFILAAYAAIKADSAHALAVQTERDILKRWVSRPDDPV